VTKAVVTRIVEIAAKLNNIGNVNRAININNLEASMKLAPFEITYGSDNKTREVVEVEKIVKNTATLVAGNKLKDDALIGAEASLKLTEFLANNSGTGNSVIALMKLLQVHHDFLVMSVNGENIADLKNFNELIIKTLELAQKNPTIEVDKHFEQALLQKLGSKEKADDFLKKLLQLFKAFWKSLILIFN
jgi:hypothetical protein